MHLRRGSAGHHVDGRGEVEIDFDVFLGPLVVGCWLEKDELLWGKSWEMDAKKKKR